MTTSDNIQNLISEIKLKNAKKILIQLPEGLKMNTTQLAEEMKNAGIDAVVCGDASYGACDLRDKEAKELGCDLLVHVGHNKFYRDFGVAVPVLYFPWMIDVSFDDVDFSGIKEIRIGLVTNIQHLHLLNDVKDKLNSIKKEAIIGGQLLGCWSVNADKIESKVDAFLFVGSGIFHSLALKTKKPVYGLDLEKNVVDLLDLFLLEKKRYANI